MENVVWVVALALIGVYMLVLSVGSLVAGALLWGLVYMLLALLNFGVALWRLTDG